MLIWLQSTTVLTNLQRTATQIAQEVLNDANKPPSRFNPLVHEEAMATEDKSPKSQVPNGKAPASRHPAPGSKPHRDVNSKSRSRVGFDGSPNPSEC